MSKQLTGIPINYGPTFPPFRQVPDGLLFFKTQADANGDNSPGLYIYSFLADANSANGVQVGSGWSPVLDTGGFVLKTGDEMSGDLNIVSDGPYAGLRLLNASRLSGGAISVNAGSGQGINIGSDAGPMTFYTNGISRMVISASGVLTVGGNSVWHAGNDGAGSGLNADLLDGQHGSYFTDLANSTGSLSIGSQTTGVLALARGGTNFTSTVQGGIVYGASTTQLGTTASGTAGFILQSNGGAAPTWVSPSTLGGGVAASAAKLTTARTISLSGDATGSVTFDGTANVIIATTVANAGTADVLTTARTIALAGDVTGSATFNGSANVTITTVIANDSHTHSDYVSTTGDTITGSLIVGDAAGDKITVNGIALNWDTSLIHTSGNITAGGTISATGGFTTSAAIFGGRVSLTGDMAALGDASVGGDMAVAGTVTANGMTANGRIQAVSTPTASTDAANKAYVDSKLSGGARGQAAFGSSSSFTVPTGVTYIKVSCVGGGGGGSDGYLSGGYNDGSGGTWVNGGTGGGGAYSQTVLAVTAGALYAVSVGGAGGYGGNGGRTSFGPNLAYADGGGGAPNAGQQGTPATGGTGFVTPAQGYLSGYNNGYGYGGQGKPGVVYIEW